MSLYMDAERSERWKADYPAEYAAWLAARDAESAALAALKEAEKALEAAAEAGEWAQFKAARLAEGWVMAPGMDAVIKLDPMGRKVMLRKQGSHRDRGYWRYRDLNVKTGRYYGASKYAEPVIPPAALMAALGLK